MSIKHFLIAQIPFLFKWFLIYVRYVANFLRRKNMQRRKAGLFSIFQIAIL